MRALADQRRNGEIAGHDGGKLLAAEPGDDVVGTHAVAQHLREHLQDRVAHRVAKPIVDRLEVVEIEHHHRHGLAAQRTLRGKRECMFGEGAAVHHAG